MSTLVKASLVTVAAVAVGGIAYTAYQYLSSPAARAAPSTGSATEGGATAAVAKPVTLDSSAASGAGASTSSLPERTFVILKPDSLQRGKMGAIIEKIEARGYKLCGMKMLQPSKELVVR